jgi:hypothetical protein
MMLRARKMLSLVGTRCALRRVVDVDLHAGFSMIP